MDALIQTRNEGKKWNKQAVVKLFRNFEPSLRKLDYYELNPEWKEAGDLKQLLDTLDIAYKDSVFGPDHHLLDEVVVIGYGTMKKSDLTGAVSSIGNKDIKDSPVSNLGQAIQGKISGVQIVDAGKPGDNVSIKIRGLGSINNCDPLVVIDGVPTDWACLP